MAIITGTAGDDKYSNGTELRGSNGDDQIYGLAGSDSLVGFDGDDLLEGSAGADELWGGYGFDYASYQGSLGAQASRMPEPRARRLPVAGLLAAHAKVSAAVCWRMPPSAARAFNEVGEPMPFKPNYNQQRNERNRAKEQKKQEKLQRREEEVARRKAAGEEGQSSPAGPETSQDT